MKSTEEKRWALVWCYWTENIIYFVGLGANIQSILLAYMREREREEEVRMEKLKEKETEERKRGMDVDVASYFIECHFLNNRYLESS